MSSISFTGVKISLLLHLFPAEALHSERRIQSSYEIYSKMSKLIVCMRVRVRVQSFFNVCMCASESTIDGAPAEDVSYIFSLSEQELFFITQRTTEGFYCKSFPAALWSEPGLINRAAGPFDHRLSPGRQKAEFPFTGRAVLSERFVLWGEYCAGRSERSQKLWSHSCGQDGISECE